MIELEFLGRSADGASLVLSDKDGQRYEVLATDELRSAAARASLAAVEQVPAETPVSPGRIQTLLRTGLTTHEVAELTSTDHDRVLRYYSPVAAEIDLAITRARDSRIGSEPDAPLMGELVIDRLGARGIDLDSLVWSAGKEEESNWVVTLTFAEDSLRKRAQWELSAQAGSISALDDVAAELTETIAPTSTVRALFAPVSSSREPQGRTSPSKEQFSASDVSEQEKLVDELNALRGKAQVVLEDIDGEGQEEAAQADDADTGGGENANAGESPDLEVVEKGNSPESATEPKKRRRGRKPVPSWDEIVFGTRSDG